MDEKNEGMETEIKRVERKRKKIGKGRKINVKSQPDFEHEKSELGRECKVMLLSCFSRGISCTSLFDSLI